jgi:hypothetical protein
MYNLDTNFCVKKIIIGYNVDMNFCLTKIIFGYNLEMNFCVREIMIGYNLDMNFCVMKIIIGYNLNMDFCNKPRQIMSFWGMLKLNNYEPFLKSSLYCQNSKFLFKE